MHKRLSVIISHPPYLYFPVLLFYTLVMSISKDFVLQMLTQVLVLHRPKELSRGEVILRSASGDHSPGTGLSCMHFASHHNQITLHGCPAFSVISPLQIVVPSHSVSKEITFHFRPLIGAQNAFGSIPILSNSPGEKKKQEKKKNSWITVPHWQVVFELSVRNSVSHLTGVSVILQTAHFFVQLIAIPCDFYRISGNQ